MLKEYLKKFYGMYPYIHIEKNEWEYIKKTYNKDEIIDELAEILHTYPPPIPTISEEETLDAYKKLKGTWWNDILIEKKWFPRNEKTSKWPLTFEGSEWYFKRVNTGNNASNSFHVENRWKVDWVRSPSGWRAWQTVKGIRGIVKAFFTFDKVLPEVNFETVKAATVLRKYVASQFKPAIAKAFFDRFKSKNVLDFSAGWGDRLAGFFAAEHTSFYLGIDPNSSNHPNYEKQIAFYKKHKTFFEEEKSAKMLIAAAEDVDYSEYENFFDTIFTSPPYFDTERYSTDPNQSWVRYKKFDDWNTGFLHTTLDKIIPTLKKDGILAINIADVYSSPDKGYFDIVNSMNDFLESKGLTYKGCIGMELTKRPNSGGAGTAASDFYSDELREKAEETKDYAFGEPIWIWQK